MNRYALLACACLAGCGESGSAVEAVRRYAVGDTVAVDNLAPVVPDTLNLQEVARYGLVDGAPEDLFTEIFAFGVGPDGDVYVHDQGEGIRRFDREGGYVEHTARRGEGPGEVGHLAALEVGPDGRVVAVDLGNRRVSVLEGRGSAWSVRMPGGRPPYKDGAVVFGREGQVLVGMNPVYPSEGGITHPRAVFVRLERDGTVGDTVFTPAAIGTHCPELSEARYGAGFWDDSREPYLPKVKWALGADGTLAVGCPATYHFYLYAPDGSVMRIARARHRVEVSEEERSFFAAFGRGDPPGETLPAYAKIRLSDDGRVWVWPSQPGIRVGLPEDVADQYGVSHTWAISWRGAFDVFDRSGRWLAVVKLPGRARYSGFPTEPGVVIRGDTVWAVERDELGIDTVVRYLVEGLTAKTGQ